MREIKFRGKNNGNWIYGSLITRKSGNCYIVYEWGGVQRELQIDPKTIGQYTGLKDKHGKEIYEGDIVDIGQTVNGVSTFLIVYNDSKARFEPQYYSNDYKFGDYEYSVEEFFSPCFYSGESELEIIGNIHEEQFDD